jgi:hypothetical protein
MEEMISSPTPLIETLSTPPTKTMKANELKTSKTVKRCLPIIKQW